MERIISEEHSFRLWVLSFFDRVDSTSYSFDGNSTLQDVVTPEIALLLQEVLTKEQVFDIAKQLWNQRSQKIINLKNIQ